MQIKINMQHGSKSAEITLNHFGSDFPGIKLLQLISDYIGGSAPEVEEELVIEKGRVVHTTEYLAKSVADYVRASQGIEVRDLITATTREEHKPAPKATTANLFSLFEVYPEVETLVEEAKESLGTGIKTGIKFDSNMKPKFQTKYHCPYCGYKGTRYLFDRSERCDCFECQAKLKLEIAGKDKPQDENGNFYVATEELL